MKNSDRRKKMISGAMVLAAVAAAHAQQQPFMMSGTGQVALLPPPPKVETTNSETGSSTNLTANTTTNAIEKFFNIKIPDALANGKFNLNVRLRYEQANEEGAPGVTKNSYAPTIRTRFGYTTASLYGFQAMVEGMNTSVIGPESNYNAAGANGQGAKPSIPDTPVTRLDQGWFGYTYTNFASAKVGRQQINLDNQRFVGDSAWWQNMQTFDAADASIEPLPDLTLYYGYLWEVHRIYGGISGLAPGNTDFSSDSHLINLSYTGWKYGRFVGYTYLLDLKNEAGTANSCATYGGYFAGNAPITDRMSVDYRAEFAWQTQYGGSALDYGTEYYNLESGMNIKPVAFGAGFEDFGSGQNSGAGGGRAQFRTPLATLHTFNGWDNVFLSIPTDGLHDLYAYVQVTLPWQIPIRFVFHKFDADYGGADYGQEFDFLVSKKFGKYWSTSVEYAYYQGQDAAPGSTLATAPGVDVQKLWAQVEFNF